MYTYFPMGNLYSFSKLKFQLEAINAMSIII